MLIRRVLAYDIAAAALALFGYALHRRCSAGSITAGVPYRKVTMRPFRPEDEGLLFGVAKLAFAEHDERRTLDALDRDTVFVAELEGEPAGWVAIEESGGVLRIEQLVVHPVHEAEGIGRQLLDWAEGYAISAGAARLQIVVEEGNERARSFYGRRGFVVAGPDLLELVLPQSEG